MRAVGMPGILELVVIAVIGLFLVGLPLLVAVLVIRAVSSKRQPAPNNENLTSCPDCQGLVSRKATSCPHCGSPLQPPSNPFSEPPASTDS